MMRKNPTKQDFGLLLGFVCWWMLMLMGRMSMAQNTSIPVEVKVGVILKVETQLGKIWLSCINMALNDFYEAYASFKTRLNFEIRDSKQDVVSAASAALDLIKHEEVRAIIGPQSSMQASFVIEVGEKAQVPVITFSATSPSLTSIRSPYFFRFAQNDSSQVQPISDLVRHFGWREVVPIYADNDYGQALIPYLTDALQRAEARVPHRSIISPSASDDEIKTELLTLMTMQTRVFVLHMWYDLGSRVFTIARDIGMMEDSYVWILTHGFTDLLGSVNSSVLDCMQGVLGVMAYVPDSAELADFRVRWKKHFLRDNPLLDGQAQLDVVGLWAYDAVFALAHAVERVGPGVASLGFANSASRTATSTDLDAFGVSRSGPQLRDALESTALSRGMAGEFRLVDGQLQSTIFQIVNVVGQSGNKRAVGFWTPQGGLRRTLGAKNKSSLGSIIWPGDAGAVPKGWAIPTNEKKLRIGVPKKDGFTEFVTVTHNPTTNETDVEGFCIDVFQAVVQKLPYALPYELIPFVKPDGSSAGDYDALVYQVYLGNYDAVVGDTTIRWNRSEHVDFTLPYTDSGVVMVVPLKDSRSKNAWVFLKPLTWDLWLTTTCFFIFIGFVVWVLEHRINEDFRGPPSHQVGTSFWFSFSTLVFAQRERVVSNLARFVVIIWVFVVLILTQSYTASLTSLLTVQKLQPTVTDVNWLKNSGLKVGYVENAFVYELLISNGFQKNNIIAFHTAEECDELLSKGVENGGIAAAIDETPDMKLFLAKYCNKYAMIGPIFKTGGFGFVFPRGSPLAGDISRAILNLTEGDEMKKIESKWFSNSSEGINCSADTSGPSISSNSLGLDSFWGLFLIAGVASASALLIFGILFLCQNRHLLLQSDSQTSLWRRIKVMFKAFDKRDLSSHTFKKSEASDTATVMASPTSNFPPSPSVYSNYFHGSAPASPFSQLHHHHQSGTPDSTPHPTSASSPPEFVQVPTNYSA